MYIIKKFNNEILFNGAEKNKVMEEALIKYGFTISETEEEIVDLDGIKLTKENADEIIKERNICQQEQFKQEFFKTSLGYIRRKVNLITGEVNFLTDILPNLEIGTPIITYNEDKTQNFEVKVTKDFIKECKQQLLKDFYSQDEEEV